MTIYLKLMSLIVDLKINEKEGPLLYCITYIFHKNKEQENIH